MSVATLTQPEEVIIKAPSFRGGALELGACRDIEVCLDGPAGTGKTFAALFKIHLLLSLFPGAKALVARKSNTALAGSALATYRDHILHPSEHVEYFGGNKVKPAAFMYPNGSILVVNGLDKPSKVKSWEFDIAFINEATEITIEDLEFVRSRLRNGKTPYPQIILDCNPDAPNHWLNQRMIEGKTTRLLSRHEDNPRFHDGTDWTEEGYRYIYEILGGLTGVRLSRLRYGVWAAATGSVFEDSWDRARNVITPFHIPPEYPSYLLIDFGYTNPFVCLWIAIDGDGRIYVYRQIYMTRKLVEDHAEDIKKYSRWGQPGGDPLPREIICDWDAEGRATLERHLGLRTTKAEKAILEGIQAFSSRLRQAGDGKARFFIFRDCLVERDRELANRKEPICIEDEFDVYVWQVGTDGKPKSKEAPVDAFNHGIDAARYGVARFDLKPREVTYSTKRIY